MVDTDTRPPRSTYLLYLTKAPYFISVHVESTGSWKHLMVVKQTYRTRLIKNRLYSSLEFAVFRLISIDLHFALGREMLVNILLMCRN